jgi:hypothetical protein
MTLDVTQVLEFVVWSCYVRRCVEPFQMLCSLGPPNLCLPKCMSEMEEAVSTLLGKAAEKVQQETVRILKDSRTPKDNLTRAKKCTLHSGME